MYFKGPGARKSSCGSNIKRKQKKSDKFNVNSTKLNPHTKRRMAKIPAVYIPGVSETDQNLNIQE